MREFHARASLLLNWCKMVFYFSSGVLGQFLDFESVIVFIIDSALLEPEGGIKTIFNHFRNKHARQLVAKL